MSRPPHHASPADLPRRALLRGLAASAGVAAAGSWMPHELGSVLRAQADGPVAQTTAGKVRGYMSDGIHAFKGIRYGADTAPPRRFLPPVPPAPWQGVRDATTFGLIAPRPGGNEPMSEDCLHLNLWTPGLRDGRKRPVMVWFHPGAYSGGHSNDPDTDGTRLAKRGDVVVVTVNHRLNAFGYLYLAEFGGPELADSGNVGMLDLVLSLQWVRDNIAEFGGDPGRVLIFGQSGGGAKSAVLMAMPAARGLFHGVITMSGQQITASRTTTATAHAKQLLDALKLSPADVNVLKTLPMADLANVARAPRYLGPVKDGRSVPDDPFEPGAPALSADIPMILGNTHDETRGLIGRSDPTLFALTWEQVPAALGKHVPQFIGSLDRQMIVDSYRTWYPHYSPSDVFFSATTAARSWRGQVIEANRRAAQPAGVAPTWVFQLDWPSPEDGGKWGAYHGLDVPLCFDNVARPGSRIATPVAQQVADRMSATWIAFARTWNPNNASIPPWPAYDLATRATMVFDAQTRVVNDPRGNERRLFDPVVYVQPGT